MVTTALPPGPNRTDGERRSHSVVSKRPRHSKTGATSLDKAGALLIDVVKACRTRCSKAISMLFPSKWMRSRSQAVRDRSLRALVKLTRRSNNTDTLMASYYALGQHNVRSVVRDIVKAASAKPSNARPHPRAAVDWINGFPRDVQLKALEEIIAKAQTAQARKAAKSKLNRLD